MRLRRFFSRIHSQSEGFTLIELIVALLITAAISGAITTTVLVMQDTVGSFRNKADCIGWVRNAETWIQEDGKMAQAMSVNAGSPSGLPLSLSWVEWGGVRHDVWYNVNPGQRHLYRSEVVTSISGSTTARMRTLIARHVIVGSGTQTETTCWIGSGSETGQVFVRLVTSQAEGSRYEAAETRTFLVTPRALAPSL